MQKVFQLIKSKPIIILLLAVPLAILSEYLHWGDLTVFILAALAVVPLASYIGESTEELAHYTGPRLGGLLNATLGNAAELIITSAAPQTQVSIAAAFGTASNLRSEQEILAQLRSDRDEWGDR